MSYVPLICAQQYTETRKTQLVKKLYISKQEDEIQLELSLPWLKSVIQIIRVLDITCTHQGQKKIKCKLGEGMYFFLILNIGYRGINKKCSEIFLFVFLIKKTNKRQF